MNEDVWVLSINHNQYKRECTGDDSYYFSKKVILLAKFDSDTFPDNFKQRVELIKNNKSDKILKIYVNIIGDNNIENYLLFLDQKYDSNKGLNAEVGDVFIYTPGICKLSEYREEKLVPCEQ